jgi:phage shock protein A
MSIIDRIRRIARANINSLLDRADTPEMALEEKIAELEKAVQEAREALAAYAVSMKRVEKEHDSLQAARAEWQRKAEAAVQGGDEKTARRALAERMKADDRLRPLAPSVQRNRDTYDELKQNLVTLNDQLAATRARLTELKSRQRAAEAQKVFGRKVEDVGDRVTGADFERLEDAVSQAEIEVEIEREVRGEMVDAAGLEKRSRDLELDAELRALKDKVGGAESNPE